MPGAPPGVPGDVFDGGTVPDGGGGGGTVPDGGGGGIVFDGGGGGGAVPDGGGGGVPPAPTSTLGNATIRTTAPVMANPRAIFTRTAPTPNLLTLPSLRRRDGIHRQVLHAKVSRGRHTAQ